jgi:hypothetical protein
MLTVVLEFTGIVVVIALSILGLLVVRRTVPLAVLKEQPEVAGVTFAVLGGFYGIVLAFVLVASWERFERARDNTEHEANALGDLYRQAGGLPGPVQQTLTADINAYLQSVIEDDWPAMADDRISPQTQTLYFRVWRTVLDTQPANDRDVALFQCMVQTLDSFSEARRDRLLYMRNALPAVIWRFLLFFAVITIGFTYFFGMPRLLPQVIITGALAATIACTLFIIWEMQTPFSGAVRVPDRAFRVVLGFIPEQDNE